MNQFEPQFQPEDLLQMANRNFVINMVIRGEKAPAFSAKTLSLPPIQADNSPQIVEISRRAYSRARAEVEEEIQKLLEKESAPVPQPAKNWVTGTMQNNNNHQQQQDSAKKRTRSRSKNKNKPNNPTVVKNASTENTKTESSKETSDKAS